METALQSLKNIAVCTLEDAHHFECHMCSTKEVLKKFRLQRKFAKGAKIRRFFLIFYINSRGTALSLEGTVLHSCIAKKCPELPYATCTAEELTPS